MRISTSMIYDSGVASMQQRTSTLLRTQQQISSGRRILTPSDDPVAAARSLEVTQSQSINRQYQTTQENARSTLGIMDSQLSSMSDLLGRVHELVVQGGNATLSLSDRKSIATELRARFEEMVGLANSTDGRGQYLFSGYQGTTKPFAGSVETGVTYMGDDGVRTLQISGARNLPVSNSGNDIFMRIKNGNGVFETGIQGARSANVRSVAIDAGTVTDPILWNAGPASVELRFWVDDQGGRVATKGHAVAAVMAPTAITAGANDTFDIAVDGRAPVAVTLTPGPAFSTAQVEADINAALAAAGQTATVTVSVDAADRLVISSDAAATSATASSVALTQGAGDTGQFASLFGAATRVDGFVSVPGQTFYDLVIPSSGHSLLSGGPSSTTPPGISYTHPYTSGAAIQLASVGSGGDPAFDLGASVVVTGVPNSGDRFSLDRVSGGLVTSPATISRVNSTIDKGIVTDPVKWSLPGNSRDIELRFWVDTGGAATTSGQALGAVVIPSGASIGVANQFSIQVDGAAAPIPVTLGTAPPADTGPFATPQAFVAQLQADLDAAVGPGRVTASLDASDRLVLTSATSGTLSKVVLSEGNGALAAFFGGVTRTDGTGAPGATYYDLVDVASGHSLLHPGTPSATGAGGTFTEPYASVHGTLTGAVDLSAGIVVAGGTALTLSVDGVPRTVSLPADTYDQNNAAALVQAALDGASPPVAATASVDANNRLVLVSDGVFGDSAVTVATPVSAGAAALLGGAAATVGSALQYGGDTTINLKGATFDYGASVTISGQPADGDAFTIKASADQSLGNGYFVTAAKTIPAANMGNGIVGTGEVIDKSKWDSPNNSRQLEVRFWKDPADTRSNAPVYYDLVDARTEKSLFTDTVSTAGAGGTYTHAFSSGDAIPFSGLAAPYNDFGVAVTISGTPASGDVFTLNSSTSESIFDTLAEVIHALEAPSGPIGSNSNAELHNRLSAALTNIGAAAENMLRVRADIGTRMGEIEDFGTVSSNLDLEYATTLSNLQDIDYSKAITDLMRMQMELQAAQRSFTRVSQLSLFDYL